MPFLNLGSMKTEFIFLVLYYGVTEKHVSVRPVEREIVPVGATIAG